MTESTIATMTGRVTCAIVGSVATVTIDRPDKINALTAQMWRQLAGTMRSLSSDAEVAVVIITGAGTDFSAGADIHNLPTDPDEFHRLHLGAELEIARCPKPVIAAIDGHCVGGGCEIAVAADLRFSSPRARYAITASRLGLVYPYTPTQHLVGLVGRAAAARMLYGGELMGATWALRVGLIDEISDDPLDQAQQYAQLLLGRSPITIAAAKRTIAGRHVDLAWPDRDYHEGVAAFRAGRRPTFPPFDGGNDDLDHP